MAPQVLRSPGPRPSVSSILGSRVSAVRFQKPYCGPGTQHSKASSACQECLPTIEESRNMVAQRFQGCQRRDFISAGFLALTFLPAAAESAAANSALEPVISESSFAWQADEINACSYAYPLKLPQKPDNLKWVESRKPERYSSAAPLTPDARLRIVSERLDYKNNFVISVAVGPPNSTFLKPGDTSAWDAQNVARSVLSDKSTARMTSGQRIAEIAILDAHTETIDGVRYWYYEYLTQKSPTDSAFLADVYRHSVAATAEREGYLYSVNASALDTAWDSVGSAFRQTVSSFHLTPPTNEYVPPYKDPWRFW